MALYYFHLDNNGTSFPDDGGTECQDVAVVRYEAINFLAEMTRNALPDGDDHKLVIVVKDGGGDLVFRASILFEVETGRLSASPPSPGHGTVGT
ncbi:hypothetical protein LB543_25890 [Mesorhizobium sp. ESP7-2]|uniref:DUF6894 family protein n=1 Tax=unclassified Mesorhizobium TaxID=325217 RepID=UPI001CCA82DC|nr:MULTISPECIES: hypothetical protein [unclassified Mesorhizobium]MBZ9669529.1 hypothetical protein [Mesorhizobium sp. ES1-3]MBZ9710143.1 hypothetical protein [Mesorhizobium sp. ESP7-2]